MPDSPAPRPDLTERLTVPWWWWPIAAAVAALLAAEVHLGQPGLRAWLPYVLTVPLALGVLLWLGRRRVTIVSGELRVGVARLPLRHVGDVTVVRAADKRKAMGPDLDPAAYVLHRTWVGPMVRVELTDPADPTPYWLFSTRRPDEVAALLRAQRPSGGSQKSDGRPPVSGRPS